ncbi:MAG: SOS response-associated peptidase [Burkholderiales bacterium]|nr:SOS response-associated peptidase [Burkholderiales bacterium]
MCSHYQGIKERERYIRKFGVAPPDDLGKYDVWPGYAATAIRRPQHWDVGDEAVPPREAFTGRFGLIPHWATDLKVSRNTFNARSETVAVKPSFRDAWKRAQRCIIPLDAFYEPDWRTGKAIATRIASADGEPLGVAGLWSWWKPPAGDVIHSFTMLTINADGHALMEHFHKPTDEKRMVVILPPQRYQDWLEAPLEHGMGFMEQYPSELLSADPTLPGAAP